MQRHAPANWPMVESVSSSEPMSAIPLVVHIVHRFECGGMQTLIAQCIDLLPKQRYRHAVICLTGYTEFASRVQRPDVAFISLDRQPGKGVSSHLKIWSLLRRLRPAVLHTYNISAIEYCLTGWLARVPLRIHAEHGRDSVEMHGKHIKYNFLRRLLTPVIDFFVPVSDDLGEWLGHTVGVARRKIRMISNGVDTSCYTPEHADRPRSGSEIWIGTVGRLDPIKNHAGLLEAFNLLLARFPAPQYDLRLAIVGGGPLLQTLRDSIAQESWAERVWLPGPRDDVAQIMRGLAVFVLPSLSEGTPVTILEAMATALPVVATAVGGVPQLVLDRQTGMLTESHDPLILANAIATYIADPALGVLHGNLGRERVKACYSVATMVNEYDALYTIRQNRTAQSVA